MTEIMGLNILDIAVIGLILLLSIKGLLSGFTKELFSAIGLIGGLFVASYFHKMVAEYIHSNITDAISMNTLNVISLILIFVLFLILATYIGKAISLIGSDDTISLTSRLGGMLVKIVKLFFVFSLIAFGFSSNEKVANKFKDTIESSKLFPVLQSTGSSILNLPLLSSVKFGKNTADSNTKSASDTNSTKEASANTENNITETNTTKTQEPKVQEKKSDDTKVETKEENTTKINSELNTTVSEVNTTKIETDNNTTLKDANSTTN